jgi:hypothetical protein
MEGRREEYLGNKGQVHVMLAECLENALLSPEPLPLPPDSSSLSNSPILSSALDDEIIVPPIAHLSVASFLSNPDVHEDVYTRCDFKLLPRLALASVDFNSAALLSLTSLYNALLDSGCTPHIVRDRTLFRNYIAQPVSVGTANCGSLEALGTGDVEFRYYESKFILDSFLFRVSPARFLRRLAAIVDFSTRSRVCLVTYLALTR